MQLGGMALRDGVLLLSERHWAAALRDGNGGVRVHSGRRPLLPGRERLARVPLVRGIARLAESATVLPRVRRAVGPAVLPQEDPRLLGLALAGSAAAAAVRRSGPRSPVLKELAVAALSLAPALAAVRDSRVSSFHGAEHKSIAAYEQHGSAAAADREHPRCGTNLLMPLAATSLLGNLLLRRVEAEGNPLAVLTTGLVSIGGAVELFSWMARHQGHPVAQILGRPGIELQRLFTTREPTEEQLDIAHAALTELLRLEGETGELAPGA